MIPFELQNAQRSHVNIKSPNRLTDKNKILILEKKNKILILTYILRLNGTKTGQNWNLEIQSAISGGGFTVEFQLNFQVDF